MKENKLYFRPDGTLHVLQVSDPQDLVHPRKAMLNMLGAAYDGLKPDLVLFTGDNTLGNHLLDVGPKRIVTLNRPEITLRQMRRALRQILKPVDDRNIPFGMIYGNHDDMNDVSKEQQFALYRAYETSLPMNETDRRVDCDTYVIRLCRADGSTAWALYMLDSAYTDETGGHCVIKEETVRWFTGTAAALKEENGGENVPGIVFLHVPLPETERLCMPCEKTHPGAVKTDTGWVCLDPTLADGVMGESVSVGEDPYGLFDAIKEAGCIRAVVSGHDHLNCFDGVYDGVRFIQTGAASFRCYGGRVRGVREFVFRADDPVHFGTKHYTYDEICGRGVKAQLRYFWDADDKVYEKWTVLGAGLLLGAAGAAISVAKLKKRR